MMDLVGIVYSFTLRQIPNLFLTVMIKNLLLSVMNGKGLVIVSKGDNKNWWRI